MNKVLYNIITFFLLLALIILFYVLYKNKDSFIGTREWNRTRNMSYDIRGEPIIPYYQVGVFNQPEVPYRYGYRYAYPNRYSNRYSNRFVNRYPNPYYPEDYLGYTYDYVNPYQGMIPPVFASPYSVPYETSINK
jgi:hypothetical protein